MTQTSLWQENINDNDFAELCNGLYAREIRLLSMVENANVTAIQGRLKSLNHYVSRTAHLMLQAEKKGLTPLILDIQNASWSAKQSTTPPSVGMSEQEVCDWYVAIINAKGKQATGLVVPIFMNNQIVLDSIDRIDVDNMRVRTNIGGWFSPTKGREGENSSNVKLLKANKKVMIAACAGHNWQNSGKTIGCHPAKLRPHIPTLRELLLSCAINWKKLNCL